MSKIPEGSFYIRSRMTGFMLSIAGMSQNSGAQLVIEPKNDTNNKHQIWTYDKTEMSFKSKLTPHFCITVAGGTFATGTPIINETYVAGQNFQQWKAPHDGTIQTTINKDYVIGLEGGSGGSGTKAILHTRTAQPAPHMMWDFESAA